MGNLFSMEGKAHESVQAGNHRSPEKWRAGWDLTPAWKSCTKIYEPDPHIQMGATMADENDKQKSEPVKQEKEQQPVMKIDPKQDATPRNVEAGDTTPRLRTWGANMADKSQDCNTTPKSDSPKEQTPVDPKLGAEPRIVEREDPKRTAEIRHAQEAEERRLSGDFD
jgi:hypothetical protein